jgi:hypothetical protein
MASDPALSVDKVRSVRLASPEPFCCEHDDRFSTNLRPWFLWSWSDRETLNPKFMHIVLLLQVSEALKALFNTVSQIDMLPDFGLVQVCAS